MDERKKLERDLSDARKKLAMGGGASHGDGAAAGVRDVGGVKLLARAVEGVETKDLKSLVDDGKKQIGSGVVAIVGVPRTARPASSSASPPISRRASTRSSWCARAPRRWAARAAAAGPTWRRPAAPTAPRPTRRCRRSNRRWASV